MENVPPLRAAVIGGGSISEQHLGFLAASPLANLVAVCDLSPALADFSKRRYGAERAFCGSQEMLETMKPEVVHVLTPPRTHVEIASACLEAGSHVIVEKPVAPTLDGFHALCRLAEARGLRLIEDHNYRFNEPVVAIQDLISRGDIGEVREADIRFVLRIRTPGHRVADEKVPHPSHRLPCGIVHEFVTHMGYLLLLFMPAEEEVREVAARWSNHGGGELFKFDDLDALVLGDSFHGRLRFTCHGYPESFRIWVRGTEGEAETELFHPYRSVYAQRTSDARLVPLINHWVNGWWRMKAAVRGFFDKILQRNAYAGLHRFLDLSYRALINGTEPPVSYRDMERTNRLIASLLEEANQV